MTVGEAVARRRAYGRLPIRRRVRRSIGDSTGSEWTEDFKPSLGLG
jgi:hypothetical protein